MVPAMALSENLGETVQNSMPILWDVFMGIFMTYIIIGSSFPHRWVCLGYSPPNFLRPVEMLPALRLMWSRGVPVYWGVPATST